MTMPFNDTARLLLYAPNVHTGGGLVLLNALLAAWPVGAPFVAWLDKRAQAVLTLPASAQVEWVEPSFSTRLGAEWSLARTACKSDSVLCFHGLPPLLPNPARIVLFQQNRHYLGQIDLTHFALRTRMRLRAEQFISKAFRQRVSTYWVQTSSMARSLKQWYGEGGVEIKVLPFAPTFAPVPAAAAVGARFDFVYVADGEGHKNHRTLVEAWIRLKGRTLSPSLALTLSHRDLSLKQWVAEQVRVHDLRIKDLGVISHNEVAALYSRARALIFPSLSESFGLPLIEATAMGLPILAGELDFVRDVCTPAETFDPMSATSIERAVLRFMHQSEPPQAVASAADFLCQVRAR